MTPSWSGTSRCRLSPHPVHKASGTAESRSDGRGLFAASHDDVVRHVFPGHVLERDQKPRPFRRRRLGPPPTAVTEFRLPDRTTLSFRWLVQRPGTCSLEPCTTRAEV